MDKNTNSQDFWEFWRMRRQCVPGSLSPPPESEPGFEASRMHAHSLASLSSADSVANLSC